MIADIPELQHDPEQVRDLAEQIKNRPEYQEPGESVTERASDWISDRFDDVFDWLSFGGTLPSAVAWLVLAVLVGGIVAIVALAIRSGSWGAGSLAGRAEQDAIILDSEAGKSPSGWLEEAERHEAEGRWREGLLCRYRAVVTQLVELEVIHEIAGRTSGEYLAEVRQRRPDLVGRFTTLTDLFEVTWYGGAESGPAERDRFAAIAAELRGVLV